jgi:hypothetical protein
MTKPDFFIVGAPKCGTTALHKYLRSHPDLYLPESKDRCYFGSDLIAGKRLTSEQFNSRFSDWQGQKRVGESCVHYIYSRSAPVEIKSFAPDAQIVVMLRNPVDLLYSWHSQLLYLGTENISDFEEALAAEPLRRMGRKIPNSARVQNSLYYSEVARLSEHVARYFDVFGQEKVLTILLEDFSHHTLDAYHRTLRFLGVEPEPDRSLPVVNPNKRPRNQLLHKTITNNRVFRSVARSLLPSQAIRQTLLKPIQRWNKIYEPRPALKVEVRRRLEQELAAEVEALGKLIDRDLSHWSGGVMTSPPTENADII